MSSYNRNYNSSKSNNNSSIPRKRPAADEAEEKWVAEEGRFVLRQAKKRAILRVRGGRAKAIDWLTVILRAIDKSDDFLDENDDQGEIDVVDPEGVFEGLSVDELQELARDIQTYLDRETNRSNLEFWNTMKVVCIEKLDKLTGSNRSARGVNAVASDVDDMFSTKSYDELITLETQIRSKLDSNDDIDVDYWEHMLKTLISWKAQSKLRQLSKEIVRERLINLRKEQEEEAITMKSKLATLIANLDISEDIKYEFDLDPEPLLKLRTEYKGANTIEESEYLAKLLQERQRILKLGYIPNRSSGKPVVAFDSNFGGEDGQRARLLYEREAARGFDENEEIFASEERVDTASKSQWAGKYKARKPKSFNRVQMGYEWNKYNQTHYDQNHPPPKVVQGYKFNVFYPDLIDPTKAPTYKIEREGGRKRGESYARAGEVDTCLIRFTAGPPYEDTAFRIVDREWDYSAKRDRGFRSSFENGILQLHFHFKKIHYRK